MQRLWLSTTQYQQCNINIKLKLKRFSRGLFVFFQRLQSHLCTAGMTYLAVSTNQRAHYHTYYLWIQNVWDCIRGRAMNNDPRFLLVNLYQTISKVWLWGMLVWPFLSLEVHSCIVFERAVRGSRFSNMADILNEVMHLYNTGGFTCYWIFRGDKSCIVKHVRYIQTE